MPSIENYILSPQSRRIENYISTKAISSPAQRQNRESVMKLIAPVMKAIQSQSTGLKDRAKTAVIGGLPAAAAGVKPEQASKAADFVTPSILSAVGAPGGTRGIALGASAGRAINEVGKRALNLPQSKARPVLGVGPTLPGPVNDVVSEGLGTYLGSKAIDALGKTAMRAAPAMKQKGIEFAQKILKPSGNLRDKSAEIAENAIKYNVLDDDLARTAELAQDKIESLDDVLEGLIKEYKSNRMSGDEVVKALDDVAEYWAKNAAPDQAASVKALRDDFIKAHQLQKPVYGEVEKGGFVMGPASKQVNPQITEIYGSKIKGPLKSLQGRAKYESVRTPSGKFGRSEPKRDIFTPQKSVESPDDIVAMNIPKRGAKNQKIVSASPKETYSIRPETRGEGEKVIEVIGKMGRDIPVEEAQALKRGQYDVLKKMRSGGGYNVQTQAPEIMGRQAAARAYKEGVSRNVPGADVLNKQMSELIDIGSAANARLPVANRNNFFDLGDVVLASGGKIDLAAARKIVGLNRAKIAKGLYSGSGKVAKAGKKLSDPLVQAISQYPARFLAVLGEN